MNDILENIRKIREDKNLSQEQIATSLKISQSQYARFERGATKTDFEMIVSLAKAFKMEPLDVITYPAKYVDEQKIKAEKRKKQARICIEIDIDDDDALKEKLKDRLLKLF